MGRLAVAGLAVGILLVAAGCGGQTIYTLPPTKTCLEQRHVRIGGQLGFIAGTATGGAMVVHLGDNFVTVAFGQDLGDSNDLVTAWTRFAHKNVQSGLPDVLRQYGNAVTLWHKHPNDSDLALVVGCLR